MPPRAKPRARSSSSSDSDSASDSGDSAPEMASNSAAFLRALAQDSQGSGDDSSGSDSSGDDDDDDGTEGATDEGTEDDDDDDEEEEQGDDEDDNPSIASESTASDIYTESGSESAQEPESDLEDGRPAHAVHRVGRRSGAARRAETARKAPAAPQPYIGPRFALSNAGPDEWREQGASVRMQGPKPITVDAEAGQDEEDEDDDDADATQREEDEGMDDESFNRLIDTIQKEPSDAVRRASVWGMGEEEEAEGQDAARDARVRLRDEDEAEERIDYIFESELRQNQGFRTAKRRPGAPKARAMPVEQLSPEVQDLLRKANTCFVDGQSRKAIEWLEKAITIEPHIRSAWSTLALCWADLGEEEKSIQASVINAHLSRNPLTLWVELAVRSRDLRLFAQATYCYSQAIKCSRFKDKHDVIDLMWDKAMVQLELNQNGLASVTLLQILKLRPHNQEVIRALVPPLLYRENYDKAIEVLEDSATYNMAMLPDPNIDPALLMEQAESDGEPLEWVRNTFEASEVVTLADLYLTIEEPVKALQTIRRCARWLQGRIDEVFWDDIMDDDREFDEQRDVVLPDGKERQGDYGRRVEFAPPHGLDPEMRLRLGRARAMMGYPTEAKYHFMLFTQESHPLEQTDHFNEIVDEYLRLRMYQEASDILDQMLVHDELQAEETYDRAAAAMQGLGESNLAKEYLLQLTEAYPDNLDYKLRLAEVCEDLGHRQTAIELVNEVVLIRQQLQAAEQERTGGMDLDGAGLGASTQLSSFFDESGAPEPRPSAGRKSDSSHKRRDKTGRTRDDKLRMERRLAEDAQISWRSLKQREPIVFVDGWWLMSVELDGPSNKVPYGCARKETLEQRQKRFEATQDWLDIAVQLSNDFRGQAPLFPKERLRKFRGIIPRRISRRGQNADNVDSQASAMMSRLQGSMAADDELMRDATSFRGFDFDTWVGLFMKLSFVLVKVDRYAEVQPMFDHVLNSNVVAPFKHRIKALRLAWLACAIYVRDFKEAFTQVRWMAKTWQFHNEPMRMVSTLANYMGYYAMGDFVVDNNAKAFTRRSRLHEAIVAGKPKRFAAATHRWSAVEKLSKSRAEVAKKGSNAKAKKGAAAASGRGRGNRSISHDGTEQGAGSDDSDSDSDDEEEDGDDRPAHLRDLKNASKPTQSVAQIEKLAMERYEALPDDEKDRCALPTKHPIVPEAQYGSVLMTSQSAQAAMGYWFRLFAHQQNDALICLCAATSCFMRAQNRQVDNRNHVILQGFTMLAIYRKLRGGASQSMEAEYNFGRALHTQGLLSQAMKHYEKVLEMRQRELDGEDGGGDVVMRDRSGDGEKGRRLGFKPWREAAFNLALIYTLNGNTLQARRLHEKWLAI